MLIFVGKPSNHTYQWIIDHDPRRWDTLQTKLENFDPSKTIREQKLPGVGEVVRKLCPYMIRDGYGEGESYVNCATKESVLSNLSLIPSVNLEWVVLGYNGTVPKYVKYRNGSDYAYVSSTDDSDPEFGLLRPIAAGCKVYSRAWSDVDLCDKFEDTGKTVSNPTGSFMYGQTNSDWGIAATQAGGYSVPTQITVGGTTYDFCGYAMTL